MFFIGPTYPSSMTGGRPLLAVVLGAAVVASAASAFTTPGRTVVAAGAVRDLALTAASIAYVADEPGSCRKNVHLWNTATRGTWTFAGRVSCDEGPSTGAGIADVGVANRRVLWLTYVGGNTRDWMLYTATTTKKTPKQIRFASVDVDDASPIVIGEGTTAGVPFAVDRAVTYLGDNGAPLFGWTAPDRVTALAAGTGPGGARLAVATADRAVTLLSATGGVIATFHGGAVASVVRLAPVGAVAQAGKSVTIFDPRANPPARTVALPPNGTMLDYANGRLLYAKGSQVRTLRIGTGADAPLFAVSGKRVPPIGLDTRGLAWAVGKRMAWACALCIDFDG